MSRVCKILLVCEDWRQSAFARGFLTAAGVDSRVIDGKTNPGGSGHDWVKSQFVAEVANVTRFSEGRGVLGLLDEDGQGVAVRTSEVSQRLQARGLPALCPQEGRCLLLPARNIETWLYWLTGERTGTILTVDETTDYNVSGPPADARRLEEYDCRPAGEHLHSLNHTQPPAGCPSMLSEALRQLRQFLVAVRR